MGLGRSAAKCVSGLVACDAAYRACATVVAIFLFPLPTGIHAGSGSLRLAAAAVPNRDRLRGTARDDVRPALPQASVGKEIATDYRVMDARAVRISRCATHSGISLLRRSDPAALRVAETSDERGMSSRHAQRTPRHMAWLDCLFRSQRSNLIRITTLDEGT